MQFLRFGKVPEKGRSINFFKLTFDQSEDFNFFVSTGYTSEEAIEALKLDDSVFEAGVSAFEIDGNGDIVLTNVMLLNAICKRISNNNEDTYIIEGDKVGIGNDGEALVGNITSVQRYDVDKEHMSDYIFETMKENFKHMEGERKREKFFFGNFWVDTLHNQLCKWSFNGVDFFEPINNEFVTIKRGNSIEIYK